jgi:SpoVK/Ycf46/Vps4 family AAA+-type ATPase
MKKSNLDKLSNQIYKVVKVGSHFKLQNTAGNVVGTNGIGTPTRKKAYETGKALREVVGKGGKISYRLTEMSEFDNLVAPLKSNAEVNVEKVDNHKEITDFIHNEAVKLKPEGLVISDLKWKYLIRSAVRAKNIMMTGPAGCGKTLAAKALTKGLKRPDFYFNL